MSGHGKSSGWTQKGVWKEHSDKEAKDEEKPKSSWAKSGKRSHKQKLNAHSYFSTCTR